MTELKSILDEAARQGLISPDAGGRLLPFLTEHGVAVIETLPVSRADGQAWSDTETPRFVRGFHDVLITIGVVVALVGLWGLAPLYAVPVAIIVLSEILVRRQRLALPAVSLTIALFCWICLLMSQFFPPWTPTSQSFGAEATQFVAGFPIILGAYYARYRVPLSLALCIMSVLAFVLTLILRLVQWVSGNPAFFLDHPVVLALVALICALGLFMMALYFDLGDRLRRTTRSDIAFWLHLGAAPALLYSTVSLLSIGESGRIFDLANMSARTPVVVATVAALMLIGLVIDRRAFVTSGLLSLGVAIFGVVQEGNATIDTYIFTTLIIVGAIVLIIGTGWMPLRRLVLRALPPAIASRLPPG
ncbi:hypothetical protein HJA87_01925 [Rhizobium bangladeshense]|uniref:DUF2157 domain-containing protein n=1 Tax=Rhizobium bangladeshense TaxID=1138189 RepID=A0ABS7LB63_9HYPH|nr:hypothetical protein [Rhizobium bangladeshense]MBX4866659.1 hypothetical protein [Rhizobium bangladeshense]MBX4873378.1 hypothetical protein [Rhizobium bangladeshense]MBX4883374.1 hypothetical protein [Rhizobium bangladeshense]MBY3588655.1 hypothetical protein [Rhizobium bangladeshense]QSY93373.1 hypothetical protein J2J97_15280 [Rhizobium bangladeshense]